MGATKRKTSLRGVRCLWGGFVEGKLDVREVDNGFGGWGASRHYAPAIFTSRKVARQHYEDVRRVLVLKANSDPRR